MNKKASGLFSFLIMATVLVVVLKVLNWLPMAVQKESMRQYASIEEARATLGIEDIYVPSYFPRRFKWPPARIMAQGKPFTAVMMEFEETGTGAAGLVITQAASPDFRVDEKIRVLQAREKVRYDLNGRRAELTVGVCGDGGPCSGVSWDEGEYRINVMMRSPPFELIRIAESMLK